jgi:hypothetical protein
MLFLGINYARGFDLNVDLHSVDVDDVTPPTIKVSDANCHASLFFDFFYLTTLYILVLMKPLVFKS